jgi:peptidoglycan/xylan/chitin deacetylase (PgdA/CDA1 family)
MKFKLFVDVEADFYYKIPSPHFSSKDMIKWNINKTIGKLYRYPYPSSRGLANLVELFKEENFPVTFCICGHLYLKSCDGWDPMTHPKKPENPWYHDKIGKDWYYWDQGISTKSHLSLCLGEYIEKEMAQVPFFKFGLHAFSHEALTLEKTDVIESIISSGIKAAKGIGIKIDSFGAPFELISDVKSPDSIFKILKKYGIRNVQYAGQDDGLNRLRNFSINKVTKRNGLNLYHISNYIEGTSGESKVKEILSEIEREKDSDKIYVLVTHDFTWKNLSTLKTIIKKLKEENEIIIC